MDLSQFSKSELLALKKDIDLAIKSYDERKRKEAMEAVESVAREHGFLLTDLTGKKKASVKVPPKYVDPNDASHTWTGRGRKPRWVSEFEGAGGKLEDIAI